MTEDQTRQQDPKDQYPQPEFGEQAQRGQHPGFESEMSPEPDYGYDTYKGFGRLEGKKTIITGGDSGIGRAVALAFAREGADVLISYLEEEESDADETVQVVEEAGRKAVKVPGDIVDEEHCKKIIETAVEEFGQIDVLVNNAAHQMTVDGLADISTDLFDRTFKTNVYAMFWLCQAALPHMQEGGSFINTSSIQAYQPSPVLLPYSATKGAQSYPSRRDSPLRSRSTGSGPTPWRPVRCGPRSSRPPCRARRSLNSAAPPRWDVPHNPPSSPPPTFSWPPRKPASSTARRSA